MKVILLAPTSPPAGGIAGWTVRMMSAQLKDNWEVGVVDEKAIGKRQIFGTQGKRNMLDETKRCMNIWNSLRKALKDSEAKVVHSCIPSVTSAMMREYVCACITKRKGRKFIIHFRCTVPNTIKGKLGLFMLKRLCNMSDLIITLNEKTNLYLAKITTTPTQLIPNFIVKNELVDHRNIREELKTVIYVGGLIEDKGIYDLLSIAASMPDIQFRLIGEGNVIFKEYCQQNRIDNVVFTGPKDRNSVKEELIKADVFLFMTYFRNEGFSNALCEAMAAGLPCVVTDWAANADMIGKKGGIVVKVNDVSAAISALNEMRSPETRKEQSLANISKVREEYIDVVVIDQYVSAYEKLLAED